MAASESIARDAPGTSQIAESIPTVDILGVAVSAIDVNSAVDRLEAAATNKQAGYVTVTGVHGIMEAQDDRTFRAILNNALLVTPDGMPTVWIGWLNGYKDMNRVYGPELMLETCRRSVKSGHTHFIYGGNDGVAEHLAETLRARLPGVRILGTYTPPFRELNATELRDLGEQLERLRPDYFWVCLSTPKQERFMARHSGKLATTVMIGVGAACDILTGRVKDSPNCIKRAGLQWLHRLLQEPNRLWKRYLVNNPRFVGKLMRQVWVRRLGRISR